MIHAAEQEIASLEEKLADPHLYGDYEKVKQYHEKLRIQQGEVGALLKRWEQISVELEALSCIGEGSNQ